MTDLPSPKRPDDKPAVSWQRVAVWVVVGGVGLFMVISGLIGMIAKG
jgi:hypothetical protein